eukprot:TRINITY_DN10066_c0_g1_i1.p1 TRINITY_DN10066_c0_g1~~TRINITY_DN10066_c0_g1_i1.p1  ORF type:complete len:191 (+),score=40.07 TRINITY_DN10066_c0_g1_i1:24-596(+)
MADLPIILGSSSKWRKEVLEEMGIKFTCMSPDIDEKAIRHEDPKQMTLMISRAKAQALLEKIKQPSILITSDQVISCNGEVREKPSSPEECKKFLASYAQHPAECITAVVVTNTQTKESVEGVSIAKQYFKPIPESFMEELIAQGDVMWCCGGFTIEHMEPYLDHLEGEKSNVTGLPKSLTQDLLNRIRK